MSSSFTDELKQLAALNAKASAAASTAAPAPAPAPAPPTRAELNSLPPSNTSWSSVLQPQAPLPITPPQPAPSAPFAPPAPRTAPSAPPAPSAPTAAASRKSDRSLTQGLALQRASADLATGLRAAPPPAKPKAPGQTPSSSGQEPWISRLYDDPSPVAVARNPGLADTAFSARAPMASGTPQRRPDHALYSSSGDNTEERIARLRARFGIPVHIKIRLLNDTEPPVYGDYVKSPVPPDMECMTQQGVVMVTLDDQFCINREFCAVPKGAAAYNRDGPLTQTELQAQAASLGPSLNAASLMAMAHHVIKNLAVGLSSEPPADPVTGALITDPNFTAGATLAGSSTTAQRRWHGAPNWLLDREVLDLDTLRGRPHIKTYDTPRFVHANKVDYVGAVVSDIQSAELNVRVSGRYSPLSLAQGLPKAYKEALEPVLKTLNAVRRFMLRDGLTNVPGRKSELLNLEHKASDTEYVRPEDQLLMRYMPLLMPQMDYRAVLDAADHAAQHRIREAEKKRNQNFVQRLWERMQFWRTVNLSKTMKNHATLTPEEWNIEKDHILLQERQRQLEALFGNKNRTLIPTHGQDMKREAFDPAAATMSSSTARSPGGRAGPSILGTPSTTMKMLLSATNRTDYQPLSYAEYAAIVGMYASMEHLSAMVNIEASEDVVADEYQFENGTVNIEKEIGMRKIIASANDDQGYLAQPSVPLGVVLVPDKDYGGSPETEPLHFIKDYPLQQQYVTISGLDTARVYVYSLRGSGLDELPDLPIGYIDTPRDPKNGKPLFDKQEFHVLRPKESVGAFNAFETHWPSMKPGWTWTDATTKVGETYTKLNTDQVKLADIEKQWSALFRAYDLANHVIQAYSHGKEMKVGIEGSSVELLQDPSGMLKWTMAERGSGTGPTIDVSGKLAFQLRQYLRIPLLEDNAAWRLDPLRHMFAAIRHKREETHVRSFTRRDYNVAADNEKADRVMVLSDFMDIAKGLRLQKQVKDTAKYEALLKQGNLPPTSPRFTVLDMFPVAIRLNELLAMGPNGELATDGTASVTTAFTTTTTTPSTGGGAGGGGGGGSSTSTALDQRQKMAKGLGLYPHHGALITTLRSIKLQIADFETPGRLDRQLRPQQRPPRAPPAPYPFALLPGQTVMNSLQQMQLGRVPDLWKDDLVGRSLLKLLFSCQYEPPDMEVSGFKAADEKVQFLLTPSMYEYPLSNVLPLNRLTGTAWSVKDPMEDDNSLFNLLMVPHTPDGATEPRLFVVLGPGKAPAGVADLTSTPTTSYYSHTRIAQGKSTPPFRVYTSRRIPIEKYPTFPSRLSPWSDYTAIVQRNLKTYKRLQQKVQLKKRLAKLMQMVPSLRPNDVNMDERQAADVVTEKLLRCATEFQARRRRGYSTREACTGAEGDVVDETSECKYYEHDRRAMCLPDDVYDTMVEALETKTRYAQLAASTGSSSSLSGQQQLPREPMTLGSLVDWYRELMELVDEPTVTELVGDGRGRPNVLGDIGLGESLGL